MEKFDYIKCMDKALLVQFLSKGGFCPEKVDLPCPFFSEKRLSYFLTGEDPSEITECEVCRSDDRERSKMCTRCIEEFLSEDISL